MRSVFEWFRERGLRDGRPWLILGKGPSFGLRNSYDLSRFHLLSLNHSVREEKVLLAHIIDYDVAGHVGEVLGRNAEYVVMPWVPHVKNVPGERTLAELADSDPVLKELRAENRLLWYNLSTAPVERRRENSPVVRVSYFSGEAALNMLAQAGVRHVRSLGIDGGTTYSSSFEDLKDKSLLTNTQESFDVQFRSIAHILLETGIDYAPLYLESPIRVYVGAEEAQMLPVRVLEFSIRKNTSMTVEVFPLCRAGIEIPKPRNEKNRPRTPFSFQRFLVPALAGHRGRAIYLDSDMQVFADMRLLWSFPFDGANVLSASEPRLSARRPQFSVMLLDCAALDWDVRSIVEDLDAGRLDYEGLMYDFAPARRVSPTIPGEWNSLERYEVGRTCLLHYTDMNRQPWVTTENPLGYLWTGDLLEAVDGGYIPLDYVREQVDRGYVRPSLMYQIENRVIDAYRGGMRMLANGHRLDHDWRPPSGHQIRRTPPVWSVPHRILASLARQGRVRAREILRAMRGWQARSEPRISSQSLRR